MTKEEFEKKFKVDDEFVWIGCSSGWVISHIGNLGFTAETGVNIRSWRYSECDLSEIKKVEPIKKLWRHVYKVNKGLLVGSDILETSCKQPLWEYLKEPTEITLDEL